MIPAMKYAAVMYVQSGIVRIGSRRISLIIQHITPTMQSASSVHAKPDEKAIAVMSLKSPPGMH